MVKRECEDCGEECKRRTRCKHCGRLVCGYCRHHFHGMPHIPVDDAEIDATLRRMGLDPVKVRAETAQLIDRLSQEAHSRLAHTA